jgi:hypothetical protein
MSDSYGTCGEIIANSTCDLRLSANQQISPVSSMKKNSNPIYCMVSKVSEEICRKKIVNA